MATQPKGELAVAYVSITPSFDGFRRDVEREVGASMRAAAPAAGAAGASAGQSFGSKFSGAAKAAMAAGAAVIGSEIVQFGMESVRAFADAEQAQIQLSLAFEKFPALADTSQAALESLNAEMQRKAAIDGDSLNAADAVLARFGFLGSEIVALTPLLVDYATIAGVDASTAATTLGKALLGNARALKDLGVVFKPTGDRARDLATLMGLLEEKVGGAGAAFKDSAAGALASFDLVVEDAKETIGKELVPALQSTVSVVEALSPLLPTLTTNIMGMSSALGVLAGAAAKLPIQLPDWLTGVGAVTLGTAVNPLGGAGAFLNAVTGGVAEQEAALRALGATYDELTGKWTLSQEMLAALKEAGLDPASVSIDDMKIALIAYRKAHPAAQGAVEGLTGATEAEAEAYRSLNPEVQAYLDLLGDIPDAARAAIDATFLSDEERRGRAQDAYASGDASRGDGTMSDQERRYWEERAQREEAARRRAQERREEQRREEQQRQEAAGREAQADADAEDRERQRRAAERQRERERLAAERQRERERLAAQRQAIRDNVTGRTWLDDLIGGTAESATAALIDTLLPQVLATLPAGMGTGFAEWLQGQNARLSANIAARAEIAKQLDKANQDLAQAIAARDNAASSFAESAVGNITQWGKTPTSIKRWLTTRLAAMRTFAANLKALAARGLPLTFLRQILAAGVDGGSQVAAALLRANDGDWAQIVAQATELETTADVLGKDLAGQMYQGAVDSAQAIVDGLESQKAALEAEAQAIGTAIRDGILAGLAGTVRIGISGGVTEGRPGRAREATPRATAYAAPQAKSFAPTVIVNNPAPEPTSTSLPVALRRTAWEMGV